MRRPDQLPKPLKREIRDLAGLVHERLLTLELQALDEAFAHWREGAIDAFELAARVHRFHEGPPRRLWLSFNTNDLGLLAPMVAAALGDGTLRYEEASEEVKAYLAAK